MSTRTVLFVAAENGALPRGKVGGIGDVIRDLPRAMARRGWKPTVITPAYGMFADHPRARTVGHVDVAFAGSNYRVQLAEIALPDDPVRHLVLEHERFSPCGGGRIYCDDPPERPFETDATKFAFFCAAVAACLSERLVVTDVVHLHDWHAALVLALRAWDPRHSILRQLRIVYTIHNLALQGIRPLRGHDSALESWFPKLRYAESALADPRYADCVNPVALAIRLADNLNTVSPTYASEIVHPNRPQHGFSGGEGLESDLQAARARLSGILNGCDYSAPLPAKPSWKLLRETMQAALQRWMADERYLRAAHYLAINRLASMPTRRPGDMLVSIGRITDQKVRLFLEPGKSGTSALEEILGAPGGERVLVMLGSGDPTLEQRITALAARHDKLLFLNGYTDELPDLLYRAGDLFLMPSSFEPCGISQMLAMRAGQACVVHGVGGLKDTVEHLRTGFVFGGQTPGDQAARFSATVGEALALKASGDPRWKTIGQAAAAQRFDWDSAAKSYESQVYGVEGA